MPRGGNKIWVKTPWFGAGEEPEPPSSLCHSAHPTGVCVCAWLLWVCREEMVGSPRIFWLLPPGDSLTNGWRDGGKDGCPNSGFEVHQDRVKAELAQDKPCST